MSRQLIDIQKQLLPDLTKTIQKRYSILKHIAAFGTVGRRTLSAAIGFSERVLRAEIDFLKDQGLLGISSAGMQITDAGRKLLGDLEPLIKDLFGLTEMEEILCARFGLRQVIIVPGNSEQSPHSKRELGLAGALALRKYAANQDIIAVTGGSTMAEIAERLAVSSHFKGSMFVPARGGLGESLEFQANTIASHMAKRTGGRYRLLHVPDHLSEETYQSLIQEPNIQEVVSVIRQARIVIHGIGDALTMARRRKTDPVTQEALKREGALAEAFGYYFDQFGKVVHKMPTVGLRLEDIQQMETVIAVAGGSGKAEAIAAVMKCGHEDILVTDEAAAQLLVQMV